MVFVPNSGWIKINSVGRGSKANDPLICPEEKVFSRIDSPTDVFNEISTGFGLAAKFAKVTWAVPFDVVPRNNREMKIRRILHFIFSNKISTIEISLVGRFIDVDSSNGWFP